MILKRLFNENCFDYKQFIINNMKSLSIDTIEAMVLIKILDSYKQSDIFNYEKIKESLVIKKNQYDSALGSLSEKNYYNIYLKDNNGLSEEAMSIEGFFDKCEAILSSTVVKDSSEFQEILRLTALNLNKILTGTEIEIVTSLVNDDMYSKDEFEKAFLNLKTKKVINIRSLALELEKNRKKEVGKKEEVPQAFLDFVNNIK